jgi:uncharacterized membrane protein
MKSGLSKEELKKFGFQNLLTYIYLIKLIISYKFKTKVKMKNKNKNKMKSLKRRMNRTAILAFYLKRTRRGDVQRIANETGYSESHISNVKAGRRRITNEIADSMYYISRRRVRQEQYA